MNLKKFLFLGLTLLWSMATIGIGISSAEYPSGEHVHRLVKIGITGRSDIDALTELRVALVDVQTDYVTAEVTDEEIVRIKGLGLPVQVLFEDARDAVDFFAEYHTYDSMVAELNQIRVQHPDITRLVNLGHSVQGRDLLAIRITDNPDVEEEEAEIQILGNVHGNEKIGTEVCMYVVNYLTDRYDTDPRIQAWVDDREIWIVPMPNPDGTERDSRENANWVDLNRDFGYMWDHWGSSPSPFSQPEVQAIRNLVELNNLSVSIDYHSGAEVVIYPWGFHPDPTHDAGYFGFMCEPYGDWAGYPVGQIYPMLYEVHGSSVDYEYGGHGTLGFTTELSYLYAPPPGQIEQICQNNLPGVLNCINLAGRGLQGRITDAVTGEPIRGTVNVLEVDWPVYSDPALGDYHRPLLTGTYTVQVSAGGYETIILPDIAIDQDSTVLLDIELFPGGSNSLYKVSSSDNGDYSADRNNHTVTPWALGRADGLYYSIGVDGWIAFDMGPGRELRDDPGKDLTVYEGGNTLEVFSLYVSNDWRGPWSYVGDGMGTTQFDLASSGLAEARYVKIEDDGDGTPNENYPGFDLDALENTVPELVMLEVVPAETLYSPGSTLRLTATITNNSDLTLTVQAWTDLTLPTGQPYPGNPLLGPITLTLHPHQMITRGLSQVIPLNAHPGTYTYTGRAGAHPLSVLGEDSFVFSIVP